MIKNEGVITQLIGAVVDVKFKDDLPEIYTALEANNAGNKLILEVAIEAAIIVACCCTPRWGIIAEVEDIQRLRGAVLVR